jgi:hypothetical protein
MAIFLVMAIRVVEGPESIMSMIPIGLGNILVVMCAVSLALSLCVNNIESNFYHYLAVGWFFGTWTCILGLWFAPVDVRSAGFTILALVSKIRFLLPVDWEQSFNTLEFVDVMGGLVWIALFAWFRGREMGEASFGLVEVEVGGEGAGVTTSEEVCSYNLMRNHHHIVISHTPHTPHTPNNHRIAFFLLFLSQHFDHFLTFHPLKTRCHITHTHTHNHDLLNPALLTRHTPHANPTHGPAQIPCTLKEANHNLS